MCTIRQSMHRKHEPYTNTMSMHSHVIELRNRFDGWVLDPVIKWCLKSNIPKELTSIPSEESILDHQFERDFEKSCNGQTIIDNLCTWLKNAQARFRADWTHIRESCWIVKKRSHSPFPHKLCFLVVDFRDVTVLSYSSYGRLKYLPTVHLAVTKYKATSVQQAERC